MLAYLSMPALEQPEAYIGGADKLFDAQGNVANEATRTFLQKDLDAFAARVERNVQPTRAECTTRRAARDERPAAASHQARVSARTCG